MITEHVSCRIELTGCLSQVAQARLPKPGCLSQVAYARLPTPCCLSHVTFPMVSASFDRIAMTQLGNITRVSVELVIERNMIHHNILICSLYLLPRRDRCMRAG